MYEVKVDRECGCFKKSDLVNNQDFSSMEEAKAEATRMMEVIDKTFCAKHNFALKQEPLGVTIICTNRPK
jgi:hypothetical protein